MAGNMYVIYSDTFKGAGIIAGNPWACRQIFSKEDCKEEPQNVDVSKLTSRAKSDHKKKWVADTTNMKG